MRDDLIALAEHLEKQRALYDEEDGSFSLGVACAFAICIDHLNSIIAKEKPAEGTAKSNG